MSIITLLSDYGNKGSKVSKAKALLLSEISTINIVDVSHEISPPLIKWAAALTNVLIDEEFSCLLNVISIFFANIKLFEIFIFNSLCKYFHCLIL